MAYQDVRVPRPSEACLLELAHQPKSGNTRLVAPRSDEEVSEYLVGSPAFKAGVRGDPSQAGSIPVHLRVSDESQVSSDAEVVARKDADELLRRAERIRERSEELIADLGPDHPLVVRALEKAAYLEHEAAKPGEIHLR